MKHRFLLLLLTIVSCMQTVILAEEIKIGTDIYEVERIIERKIGPGTTYLRLRLPDYPLNVNIVTVDLNNPYNRIETTVANESAKGTESLVKAARRLDSPSHHPLAAANANFWVVGSQNEYPLYAGITRNASVRNGKMVTECNDDKEKWDGGPQRTGVVTVSTDKVLNIDYCTPSFTWQQVGKTHIKKIRTCNKGYRENQYAIYNSFYGRNREFMPYEVIDKKYTLKNDVTNAIENILDLDEGQQWTGGNEIIFTVKEVRSNTNGKGTLGNHDLAIVSFGTYTPNLKVGDKIRLKYDWTFDGGAKPVVEQAIGGNAMVMRKGELTEHNYNEDYNSMVYSRTAYGCSQDGKTLYMIVIDKSTDPVYGRSAGCSTAVMSEIARHFGCWNLQNFDAGGSAEMMVDYQIVNKTTEKTPRDVANGWMVFSIAPDGDAEIAAIEFDHPSINVGAGATFIPTILGYNQYDVLIDKDITEFSLSCSPEIGRCEGNRFIAGDRPATGALTATFGNLSVTKNVNVAGGAGIDGIMADNGSLKVPGSVNALETFSILSSGRMLRSAEICSLSGSRVAMSQYDGDGISFTAPSQPGIYLLNVSFADGSRVGRKIIVK